MADSAAQGVGIHGWGMVGASAASGDVGAAIAGGKAEEILLGIVQGAMVGVLNPPAGADLQLRVFGRFIYSCHYPAGADLQSVPTKTNSNTV